MKPLVPKLTILAMIPEVKAFRDTLRQDEQRFFDELYLAASRNYKMMEKVGLVIPLEKMLFAILIEQQRQIEQLRRDLENPRNHFS